MKKFLGYYNKLEEWLLVGSLVFTTCLIFIQVVMRYVFNSSLSWSEELARYIFIWQIWLGTSVGFKDGKHIRVEILLGRFKGRGKQAIEIFASLILLVFSIFLAYNGGLLAQKLAVRNSLSTALKIPLYLVYASLPVSSAAMALRIIHQMVDIFRPQSRVGGGEA